MSWRTVRLGELVDNFSVRAKDVGGADGLDFFGVSNEEGIIKTKYAAEDKAEDYKIIEKGCFAYNPYRVNVGSIGLVSDDTRGLISPAYVVFKPKPNAIIPELLFKFLKSDEGLRQIKFYARGTVRQALRFEDLSNIEITIPDFEEQQLLYNKLINSQEASNILDAELKNQLELLKKLRQQLLQDAVHGKLVEQNPKDEPASELLKKIKAEKEKLIAEKKLKKEKELPPIKPEEIPFEIPENWVWCRLGEICTIKGGKRVANGYKLLKEPTPYIYIRVSDMKNGTVDDSDLHYLDESMYKKIKQYTISKDDIYMTIVGGTIGKCGLIPDKFDNMNLTENAAKISPIFIDKVYLWKCLDSPFCQDQFIDKTKQVGVQKMALNRFSSSLIPIPPLEEQKRIVQKLDELMQYCNELEASIKQSESQNEKLLQQVLREALRKEPVEIGS
jgi:type I restriction enzyme S subunit